MTIIRYRHHGVEVSVEEGLKGLHRDYCLCHRCRLFNLENRELSCRKANLLYAICQSFNITTPVWECDTFDEITKEAIK
jgi:hypothetical protein